MVDKIDILNYLEKNKDNFNKKYSLTKIGLFGSFATDSFGENSDIDIVYKTSLKGLTFSQVNNLEDELYNVFHRDIDLVNIDYMNPLVKRKANKEIIYV